MRASFFVAATTAVTIPSFAIEYDGLPDSFDENFLAQIDSDLYQDEF